MSATDPTVHSEAIQDYAKAIYALAAVARRGCHDALAERLGVRPRRPRPWSRSSPTGASPSTCPTAVSR